MMRELVYQQQQLPNPDDVEFITLRDNGEKTTGEKRNECIRMAKGEYVAFVDDDDFVTPCYLKKQLDVAYSTLDCGSLKGLYFLNNVYDRPFIHSKRYDHWYQDDNFYYRNQNHLNCIKKSIAIDIPFPHIYVGEDGQYSQSLQASGRIQSEYIIAETLYLYFDRTKTQGQ